MRGPVPTSPHGPASRSAAQEQARPIAASLKLSAAHTVKIDESHERCVALGVSRIERPDFSPLGRPDLTVVRERNLRLYEHAAPVMEMLYEQIVNTENMVVLTDVTGTIIHSIGDDDFLSRASKVALAPGANWSESAKGTNAVGTALMSEQPTLVHADEHYLHANHFLTCSAAPILDPRGSILGVLDVSGDHRGYHQHTMALVKMSARMIENHWLTDDHRNVMRLHFHSRVEFIGTLMEGILAISADGKLVGANRGALEQLGLNGAALRLHSLTTLFGTSVSALVDRFRSPLATPMPVHSPDGRPFHIHARFNWPVWTSLAEAVKHGPVQPSPPADSAGHADTTAAPVVTASGQGGAAAKPDLPGSALAELRTGDVQMASVLDKLQRVRDRDIALLILGESGTGKALLAQAIHRDSQRAKQPFVALDCAAVPAALLEAELFGFEDGAFTGARRQAAVGKIVQANGGTLFLDEIAEMPLALQAQLLRVLQHGQVTPLGSSKSVAVDVALVCATQHKLRARVEVGQFREDLFYRLNGLAVRLPPLRERSDLMVLVRHILDRQLDAGQGQGQARLQPNQEVMRLFSAYAWPGNLRQLFNVLRTAAVMAAGEPQITREHLSDDFLEEASAPTAAAFDPATGLVTAPASDPAQPTIGRPPVAQAHAHAHAHAQPEPETRSLQAQEIDAIRHALAQAGGNISEASKRLGISRNTIYRKLRWNGQR